MTFYILLKEKCWTFFRVGNVISVSVGDCDGGPRRTKTSPAEGFVADWSTKEDKRRQPFSRWNASCSVFYSSAHVAEVPQTLQFRWQYEEFCLQPEETTVIVSAFRLKPLLKWVKRAETPTSVDMWRLTEVEEVKVTKPKELGGFGSRGPTGGPSVRRWHKVSRVQVTNLWMSASVTATASQTQTEELAWIPTCLRAPGVPPAAAPPWLPPSPPSCPTQAPCPTSKCAGDTRETRGRPVRRLFMLVWRFHSSKIAIESGVFGWWKNGCSSFLPKDLTRVKQLCGQTALKWFVELPEIKGQKDVRHQTAETEQDYNKTHTTHTF